MSLLVAAASSISLFDFTAKNIDGVTINFRKGYKVYYVVNVASN